MDSTHAFEVTIASINPIGDGQQPKVAATPSIPTELRARIRDLAATGAPLNITAVKRHSSKLLADVYALQPFVGWNRALNAAGVSYNRNPHELLSTCECRVCGFRAPLLSQHLRQCHELSYAEYVQQFPGECATAETIRAKKMRSRPGQLPHWEPLWSPEYVLDRVHEYGLCGFPLNYHAITANERSLASLALIYFGSWDETLRRIGRDPADFRKQAVGASLDRWDVIEQLRRRKAKKLSLASGDLQTEDLRLLNAARRRFGSYENALRAAGIRPSEVQKRPAFYTMTDRKLVIEEARRVAALKGEARYKAARVLHAEFEKAAVSIFGNWNNVAACAGVPVERLFEYKYLNKDWVLEWLADWVKAGNPIKGGLIFEKNRSLYAGICRHFGSFADLKKHLDQMGMFRCPIVAS